MGDSLCYSKTGIMNGRDLAVKGSVSLWNGEVSFLENGFLV